MKKFALLLACALLCTTVFVSCGNSESKDNEDTEAQDTEAQDTEAQDTEAQDTEDTEAQDTEAQDTEAQDTEAQDTEAQDTEAQDPAVEGYSNERLGLTFVPSEDIEIIDMEGYELWAQNSATGTALFIMVQETDISEIPEEEIPEEGIDAAMISVMIDAFKAQLDSQTEGVEYSQEFDIEFGNMSYVGFDYEMDVEGTPIYGSILVGSEDGYLSTITITGASEEELMEFLDCFEQELIVY